MTIRNPFRNRQTRLIFDACIESANNPSSEFYNRHGGRRSGASHRNYFWHGVTSIEKPELLKIDYGKSHGTMAYVCFRAGQEWAKAQRND